MTDFAFAVGATLVALAGLRLVKRRMNSGSWSIPWPDAGLLAAGLLMAALFWPSALILQKTVAALAMPVGLLWLLLLAGVAFGRGVGRAIALASWVLLTVLANAWMAGWLVGTLEAPFWRQDPFAVERPFDAVLVLSGGTSLSPLGHVELGGAGDRLRLAAALHHAGLAELLVASGAGIEGMHSGRDLADESRRIWLQMGVPAEDIVVLLGSRNTSEEIADYKALVVARGWRRVGLVTSAWHLQRALKLCRRAALEVEPLPADFRGGVLEIGLPWLVPSSASLHATSTALWEYLGMAVGR